SVQANIKGPLRLIQEVPTRWNSMLSMIKRLIRLRSALKDAFDSFEDGKHRSLLPSSVEWACLEEVVTLLEPLHRLTVKWSGVLYVTISCVSVEWCSLIDYYESKCGSISHPFAI